MFLRIIAVNYEVFSATYLHAFAPMANAVMLPHANLLFFERRQEMNSLA